MHPLVRTVAEYGILLVFVNVLLEQLGLPIPAAPTLIVAGALSVRGGLRVVDILAVSVAASLFADSLWYLLGRRLGLGVLKTLCRISLSPDSCVRQTSAAFERWGMPSLLVAKFIPGFSTVAPPLAGAISRRFAAFLFYDAGGALLWAGSAVVVGRIFHKAVDRGLAFLSDIGTRAFVLMGAALLLFIAFKWWQRRRFYRALRMARITAEDLSSLLSSPTPPMVLDVRTPSALAADPRRIPGARSLTFDQVQSHAFDLPADRELVLYCT
ncbi:MAG TPA: VTT domain-containing protein [Thermoanaerobaculia bacterium]